MKRLALFLSFAAAMAALVLYIDSRMPGPGTEGGGPARPAAEGPGGSGAPAAASEGTGAGATGTAGKGAPGPTQGKGGPAGPPPGGGRTPPLSADRTKIAVLDAEIPYREKVLTPEGREVDTVTAFFVIGRLTPGEGNRYLGERIRFEYYDKARPELPPGERILARGEAARGVLFAASGGGEGIAGGDMDLDFRREFVLEGGVVIHMLDKESGREMWRMDGENLSFFENRLRSTGRVAIAGDGFTVKGKGLTFELDSRAFHLDGEVHIEAEGRKLPGMATRMKGGAAGKGPGKAGTGGAASPRGKEGKASPSPGARPGGEALPAAEPPLVITSEGPLDFTPPPRSAGAPPPLPGGDPSLGRMEIRDRVRVARGSFTLSCGRAVLTFRELEGGTLDLREFHAWGGEGGRVRVEREGRTALCDRLDYTRGAEVGGKDRILLTGTPVMENLDLPFPSMAGASMGVAAAEGAAPATPPGTRKPGEKVKARVTCGDRVEILPGAAPGKKGQGFDAAAEGYRVRFTGGVRVEDPASSGPALLQAREVSFLLPRGAAAAAGGVKPGRGTADLPMVEEFRAEGEVSGMIPPFTYRTHRLFLETEQGLQRITLVDPEESLLEGDTFRLRSPEITVSAREDLVEVRAEKPPFTCTARLKELPAVRSFNPLGSKGAAGKAAEADAAGAEEAGGPGKPAGPGTFTLKGGGKLRILARGRGAEAAQTVTAEGGPFEMELLRGEDKVLAMKGEEALGLDMKAGTLAAMNCRGGGWIESPELGLEASGGTLALEQGEGETLTFVVKKGPAEGAEPAMLSFLLPEEGGTCTVRAADIRVRSDGETRLDAEGAVDARVPAGLFQRGNTGGDTGKEAGKGGAAREGGREEGAARKGAGAGAGKAEKDGADAEILSGLALPSQGSYRIRAPRLFLVQAEDSDALQVEAGGGVRIVNEEAGFEALCNTFTLNRNPDRVRLIGTETEPAVVRAASALDPSVKDTATARRIEVDLAKATATLFPGGEIVLHPYDKDHGVFDTFRIRCRNDILLRENLLELSGAVSLAYAKAGGVRTLACERLRVYFTKSPLTAGLATWDMTAYRALVKGKDSVEPPDDANRVKRIRAQEKVAFDMDGYRGACALLEWNLLSDEIRCDGLGREIEVAYGKEFSLRGGKILVRPVNEELRVIR